MENDYGILSAPDIERAVLGAMLIDDEAIGKALELIQPETFYKPVNQIIYKVLVELYDKNFPIDLLTIIERLRQINKLDAIGGEITIAALMAEATTSANVEYHCKTLKEKEQLRKLVLLSKKIELICFEGKIEPSTICAEFEFEISEISKEKSEITDVNAVRDLIHPFMEKIEQIYLAGGGLIGLATGYERFDKMTGGLINSNLVILGGKTSHGKTSFALNIANNVSRKNHPVCIFSLEMSEEEVMKGLLQIEARYDMTRVYSGVKLEKSDWTTMSEGASRLYNSYIHICDYGGLSIAELSAITKRIKREHKIELLIVDYLQLMIGRGDTREQEVASISRGLKALAKNLNIPVIALSQFSREVDRRKGEPRLSDLRESGALEQDANIVLFIYDGNDDKKDYGYGENDKHIRELIIAKNRSGKIGTELLYWKPDNTSFFDLDYMPFQRNYCADTD